MNEQQILSPELLEKELHLLVEKRVISQRIAEKIKLKIQKEKLILSQTDLVKLIDHVQFLLNVKTSKELNHQFKEYAPNPTHLPTPPNEPKTVPHSSSRNNVHTKDISKSEKKIEIKKNEQKNMIAQTNNYQTIPLSELSNDPEHIIVLFKWLEYLIDKIGTEQLPTLLDYYVDIDWITKNVYMNLLKYAKGITAGGDEKTKQYHPVAFTINEHLQSFLFIQKLKGTSMPEDFLGKINTELQQIEKTLDEHHRTA